MHLVAALLALPLASAQLNELAQEAGKKYFGTAAADSPELYSNAAYFSILTDRKEFGQLTPANGQKWSYIEPQHNVFNYTEGEVVTDIARQNGQMLRCHNLVWHRQLPSWVTTTTSSTWDKANMTAMLRQHVRNEASHWKGQCYAWDVVNEGLNEDGTYRDGSIFYRVLGEEYFKIAFEAAALADPSAKLYYNDYGIEAAGPKAEGAKRIVKLIKDAGLRIDGVGLQSHFAVGGGTPSIDAQISNMRSLAELGVEVAITELDIRLNLPVTAANLAQQKRDYKTTVGACMQVEECVGVTVWDFYDPFSWVPSVFPEQGAATLYFANFTKHPAYHGVVEAITNKTRGEDVGRKNGKGKDGKAKDVKAKEQKAKDQKIKDQKAKEQKAKDAKVKNKQARDEKDEDRKGKDGKGEDGNWKGKGKDGKHRDEKHEDEKHEDNWKGKSNGNLTWKGDGGNWKGKGRDGQGRKGKKPVKLWA